MKPTALIGAGGKIGLRISRNLKTSDRYKLMCVEEDAAAIERLRAEGLSTIPLKDALAHAHIAVLALPDHVIPDFTIEHKALFKPGMLVIGLDPAVAYAGRLPDGEGVSHGIVHPCHPPLFHDDFTPGAQTDWFGGIARQDVVCTLYRGSEDDYASIEDLSRCMFRPVRDVYRLTVEQMAIMEPGVVEMCNQTFIYAMKEALDEAVAMGVPAEAARAFVLGHIRVQLAVVFGFAGFPFSDGAMKAMRAIQSKIFKDNWKSQVLTLDAIKDTVRAISEPSTSTPGQQG